MDISNCQICSLYKNQTPSINILKKSDVMIIGISSQKNKPDKIFSPLDPSTNSGKFIISLEKYLPNKTFYKTNLTKCAPLNFQNKIRYPTSREINSCLPYLKQEIKITKPRIIIPLGKQATTFFSKYFDITLKKYHPTEYQQIRIIPVDHPSYIMIYKRKQLEQYKKKIVNLIKQNL